MDNQQQQQQQADAEAGLADLALQAENENGAGEDDVQVIYGDVEGGTQDDSGDEGDDALMMEDDEGDEGDEGEEEEVRKLLENVVDDSVARFEGHSEPVHSVAVSPVPMLPGGGFLVASGGQDEKTQLSGLADGRRVAAPLTQHTDTIIAVQFDSTGEYLATAGMDGTVQVYRVRPVPQAQEAEQQKDQQEQKEGQDEAKEGSDADDSAPASVVVEHLHTLEGPGEDLLWLCWHEKGAILAAGSADSTVWMWNARTAQVMRVFSGHGGSVLCGTFAGAEGKLLATGGEDGQLYVWSPKTGQATHTISGHRFHEGAVTCIAAHPQLPLVMTGSDDSTVCVTHAETGRILQFLKGHTGSVEAVAFCPGNKNLALSASVDGTIRVWDVNQGVCRSVLRHDEAVVCAQFLPNSVLLVSAGVDCVLRLWDARDGRLVRQWTGARGPVNAMAVSKDGKQVVLGSDDEVVRVFDLTKPGSTPVPASAGAAANEASAAEPQKQQP